MPRAKAVSEGHRYSDEKHIPSAERGVGERHPDFDSRGPDLAGEYEMVPPRAFVWTRRTGMLALDDLVPAGWSISHVIAINDQEEILATASHLNNRSRTVVLEPVHGGLK
jgi:hypothetical protein